MIWNELEKLGWEWCIGYSRTRGSHYAQAWRNLKRIQRVDGQRIYRECLIEFAKTIEVAEANLKQRLLQLEE